jgi:opacity protein-like surface antigen
VQRLIAAFVGLVFFGLVPSSAFGQKVELYVGGSYVFSPVSVNEQVSYCPVLGTCNVPATVYTNRDGLEGFEVAAKHNFSSSLALVADVTGNYGLATSGFPRNARARQYSFLGGPQFSAPRRHFTPFVHALFGGVHQSASETNNNYFITFPDSYWSLGVGVGGGIDAKVTPNFSIRIVQADDMITRLGGRTQNQPRLSAGFVFRF